MAEFHRRMPAYSPTLLLDAPMLAESLGLGRVLVKAETQRMGLPSFKILGASWATYQALCAYLGEEPEPWENINELASKVAHLKPFALATAADGNHGRAVAFMARLLGFDAKIFVPSAMAPARVTAMEKEGATVVAVEGDHDDANCVQVSAAADAIVQVPGPHRSIMVGLNCGRPSFIAWPRLRSGIDWFASVTDDAARHLSIKTALVIVTESATDPGAYERIVGRRPVTVGRVLTALRGNLPFIQS